ncbi:MAG: hypothetical protein AMJ88_13500 [Anaerolineae bacterium SM23_ 63]|nr:MAG: hypothetical protein AMJ88_13500 [Anaerolineae bacterium SM23_ 63]
MGTLECGAMVMRGYFDVFDRAIGAIEHIEKLLEETDIPTQLHVPTPMNPDMPTHIFDPKTEMQADLGRAKEMVAEACQIAQNTMAEIP